MKSANFPPLAEIAEPTTRVADDDFGASEAEYEAPRSGMKLNDILFILFRHKWKIVSCAALGLLGAAAVYFLLPSPYESKAKWIVRYVVDRSAVDNLDTAGKPVGSPNDSVILAEVEILTSSDVAAQVAEAVGVERLLKEKKGTATTAEAAREILSNLEVTAVHDSNIISIVYKNDDPHLATQVLDQLVKFYFDKHLEVHRSVGSFDLVTRQTEQVRKELNQTEEDLKKLKATAEINSPTEDSTAVAAELSKTQQELDSAETELAAQQARVKEITKSMAGTQTKSVESGVPPPSSAVIEEYRSLVNRVTQLRQTETELLSKYTDQNRIVKVKQAQIEELEKQRHDFEEKYPSILTTMPSVTSTDGARPDLMSERAKLVGLEAQTQMLRTRFRTLQERAKVLQDYGPRIEQLERTKGVQEANYKYLEASLEKARIDETLDPSRIPNIGIVQKPSPSVKAVRDVKKLVMGLACGGVAFGLAIALLIELVLDRTVKRSQDLEERLRIPLLLSIPYLNTNSQRLRLQNKSETGLDETARPEIALPENGDLLQPFCEAIRDRLGLFFELNNMAHKPKLVAVAGLAENAGASTLAAGLANALSDGTDGKVLLVDKPPATRRFYNMLMEFKESDLDYIVFDMPSLGDTSATLPLAGFMDTVLLVVEAEKSSGEAVKRAYTQLAARTKVSVVFNKSRSYGPKWLEGEI
jgi:polysaccharide biosynthesis transport protein